MPPIQPAQVGQFELEVSLDAPPERAWTAMIDEIDQWWLPDFRATGEKSVVRLDARAGGTLLETGPAGEELVWYTVQMVQPGQALYLVGHTAADWGGPSLSMLKLALKPSPDGSTLTISDSILGRVTPSQIQGIGDGWQNLFGTGLRAHVAKSRA